MAFGKWRLSRSRKGSNSSAEHNASTNGTTTPTETEGQSVIRPPSHAPSQTSILRTLTGSLKPQRPKKITEKDQEYARLHKPFTKQNLEHQRILSAFEWNFGSRTTNQRALSICSGISPCTSRQGSIDHAHLFPSPSRADTKLRVSSDLGHEMSLDRLKILDDRTDQGRADSPTVARLQAVY